MGHCIMRQVKDESSSDIYCLHFAELSGMELDWVGFGLDDIALKRLDGMAMDWIACLKELKQLELCTKWTIH